MRPSRALIFLLAILAYLPDVHAASLHPVVIVHGPTVKLSDLFAGLQPGQDCDIGPAPAPGQRLIVPPSQILAIASQFGVDLQDTGSLRGASLERPAKTVRKDEIVAVLKPALLTAGMPAGSDITLGVFASPILAADNSMAPAVAGLEYDPQTGRFSASVQFPSPDGDDQSTRVTGRTDEMVDALALTHPMAAGSPIAAEDVSPSRLRKSVLHGAAVMQIGEAAGLVTRQNLPAGAPLLRDELLRPQLVARGRPVVLRLTSGGLALTAAGTALDGGGSGDRIHVMNSSTHAVLMGTIADGADVVVDPGTAPLFLAQAGGGGQLPRLTSDMASPATLQRTYPAQEAH